MKMTIAEVRTMAMDMYNEGGDVIIECWSDEQVEEWIAEEGTKIELLETMAVYKDCEKLGNWI